MSNVSELRMNVAALKRVDPYVKDILETATHVALYTFNAETSEWEKTDVEGALFVYSRSGEPFNSFLIMNRLNTKNQVEPVTRGLDLQLHEPFLLYRNSKCDIHGIWFYDKDECVRIAAMLNKLVKESENTCKVLPKLKAQRNSNNVDIFSMLSKAQEDYNINRGGNDESGVGTKSPMNTNIDMISGPLTAPLGPDVTSQSVMDFFAKAKVNPMHFKAGDQPIQVHESKPLLARLMSHPTAITLEHIEKQQRSTTPQPVPPSHHHHISTTPMSVAANDIGNLSVANRSKKKNKVSQLATIPGPNVQDLPSTIAQSETNDSSFLRIQSPVNTSSLLNNHHTNHIIGSSGGNPLTSLFGQTSSSVMTEDVISSPITPRQGTASGTNSAPALIPPVMFAAPSPAEPVNRPLEPLTRNQLLQAVNYLLRSDPDFVNKLHEAYVKSFSEILS
ncbi:mRNA-decapping enzyme 1B [Leptopilina boulardi]|uniref:mRNA-decapping enzyme 1B n=1 Tax=Leptopilina boulardi TaxID=63433 RepID=UPI0021F5A5B4|nr:mRNA-decapping enzyme 1B [Leptopilina boulardi]